jgi:metal-sulfur cluster biosynthetic enzyme
MVTKKDVLKILKSVVDPEININIVDLGLIYNVDVNGSDVKIKMTLTTPHCPLSKMIVDDAKMKIKELSGVKNTEVELVFDPPWSPERLSAEAKKKLGFKSA